MKWQEVTVTHFGRVPGAPQVRAAEMEPVTFPSCSAPPRCDPEEGTSSPCASIPHLQRGDSSSESRDSGIFLQQRGCRKI